MGKYTKQILDVIAERPGIRTVEIADLVDCDVEMVQPQIQAEIDRGLVVMTPITAPNGKPANSFRMPGVAPKSQPGSLKLYEYIKVDEKNSIVLMPVKDFCAITDNPRQRDTKRHAAMAQKYHLSAFADVHKDVVVARLPDGKMIKLDGHTRAYLWGKGELEAPPYVSVKVREARNIEHAMAMYLEYDNQKAVETTRDRTAGALNQTNTQLQSKLMRSGSFVSAISLAKHGNIDSKAAEGAGMYNLIAEYRDVLLKIDALNPKADKFVAGVMAAAIITLRKYGDSALRFWDLYNQDMGEKAGSEKCAIEALADLIQTRRAQKSLASRHNVVDVCGKAIAACEKWMKGERYSGGIKGVDVQTYIRSIHVPIEDEVAA